MTYDAGPSHAVFRAGQAGRGSELFTVNLHNGWTITTSSTVAAGGVLQLRPGALTPS